MKDPRSIEEVRTEDNRTVGDYLQIEDGRFHCVKCGYEIGDVEDGVKHNLALRERNVEDLGENWIDPSMLLDEDIVFREFLCPDCATRISTESCKRDAPIVEEIRLDSSSL